MLLAEPLRPEPTTRLLVGGQDQQQLAGRPPAALREGDAGRHLGRDLALHVERATSADLAARDVAGPGVEGPLVGVGPDRVDVPEKREGRSISTAQAGDEIRAAGLRLEELALESRRREQLMEKALGPPLVSRRVDGVGL